MSKRENFSKETALTIAKRAAFRCSFPGCNRLLIGPGADSGESINLGQCAHIYSAAEDGPRGRAQLSADALKSPENGIFLCPQHHKLIDSKKGAGKYPASTLLYYKAMHEQCISQEIGTLKYPMLWIARMRIMRAPYFTPDTTLNFARSNILWGSNGTGKSLVAELLYCALSGKCIKRFNGKDIEFELNLSNPVLKKVVCRIVNNTVQFRIDGRDISFCPFSIDVVFLKEYRRESNREGDDIDYFCRQLNLSREQVKGMIINTDLSNGTVANKLSLNTIRQKPYEKIEIRLLRVDLQRGRRNQDWWYFSQMSQTEKSRIMIELLINYLKSESQYRPVIFIVDTVELRIYDNETRARYFKQLQEHSIHFQTIMTSVDSYADAALKLPGWNAENMNQIKRF